MHRIVILLAILSCSFGYTADIENIKSKPATINNINYPRTLEQQQYVNLQFVRYSPANVLSSLFGLSNKDLVPSLIVDMIELLQENRIRQYREFKKLLQELDLFDAIEAEIKANGKPFSLDQARQISEKIVLNYLKNLTDQEFIDRFLNSNSKQFENFSPFFLYPSFYPNTTAGNGDFNLVLSQSGDMALDRDYYSFVQTNSWPTSDSDYLEGLSSVFAKLESKHFEGLDIMREVKGDIVLDIAVRKMNYNGKNYLVVLDGDISPSQIVSVSTNSGNLSYLADYQDGQQPKSLPKKVADPVKLIGAAQLCPKDGSRCELDQGILKHFTTFSMRSIPSELMDALSEVSDQKLKATFFYWDHANRLKGNNLAITNQFIKDDRASGKNVINLFARPTQSSELYLEYKLPEFQLNPGERVYYHIPDEYSNRPIYSITMIHRQNGRALGFGQKDPRPGLTSLQVYSNDLPMREGWRYWGGHASGKNGAKFAEPRRKGEHDTLYDWPSYGHRRVGGRSKLLGPLQIHSLRILSTGVDPIYISGMYINLLPPKASKYQEYIFSPGTNFGDPITLQGRRYGGGQKYRGQFPNAVKLSHRKPRGPIPKNFTNNGKSLIIPLQQGKGLNSIEIACGDTHPDGVPNKDGGIGSLGGSKMDIGVYRSATKATEWIVQDKNIGPQGVILGTPKDRFLKANTGDHIVIQVHKDSTYVMGIRLGYNN